MMYLPEVALIGSSTVAQIDAGTHATGYIAAEHWDYLLFVVSTTDASADTTVDFKVQQAADASGTGVADITGLAITQGTAAATAEQYMVWVRSTDITDANTHVRGLATLGNGTVGATTVVNVFGFCPNYTPASNYDAATVIEIVSTS